MNLAVAYWCVLVAAVLPYIWVGYAKSRGQRYDNRDPRAWLARQDDPRVQRATAAQLNAFEAFPAFAAGVVLAQLAEVPETRIAGLALAFLIARVLHGAFYLAGKPLLRSLSWMIGIACSVGLLASAAASVGRLVS
ncbi:MAPEG family protein [Lysobacter humi (ex Lee et al. 2017)]